MSKAIHNPVQREKDGMSRRVGLALILVGLAVAAHVTFRSFLPKQFPFLPFAVAILVSCRFGKTGGGVVATLLSAVVLRCWFLEPAASFLDEGKLGLGLFVAAGLFVSWQSGAPEKKPVEAAPAAEPHEAAPFEYVGPAKRAA
jgi:hypothetical protein